MRAQTEKKAKKQWTHSENYASIDPQTVIEHHDDQHDYDNHDHQPETRGPGLNSIPLGYWNDPTNTNTSATILVRLVCPENCSPFVLA